MGFEIDIICPKPIYIAKKCTKEAAKQEQALKISSLSVYISLVFMNKRTRIISKHYLNRG